MKDKSMTETTDRWEVRYQRKDRDRWQSAGCYPTKKLAAEEVRNRKDRWTMVWIVDLWERHDGSISDPRKAVA